MLRIVRSRAPLRLGFGGGGTDVAPYCDQYGGFVLNATIDLYANCTIAYDDTADDLRFEAMDLKLLDEPLFEPFLNLDGPLKLHRAIYNRVVSDFNDGKPIAVHVSTWSDAPPGSGLGTSSTLVVAMLSAYKELLGLPLGEYDIAHLAYEIERIDCGLSGGKQDQYAATFGGFNFMEFYQDERVIVNPLRIRRNIELELETSLLLFYTGQSRESARIIDDQCEAAGSHGKVDAAAVEAMHQVKALSLSMKETLLKGQIVAFIQLIGSSWDAKKRMAKSISSSNIENIAARAFGAGAKSIKISGAGGGGYMMIFVDPPNRHKVIDVLSGTAGAFHDFRFTSAGVETWKAN
jgi:D-glycero-alpha-D-manno-heptose-7-phosphate kinase